MAFYVTTPKIIRFQFSIANHGIDCVPLEPCITPRAYGCTAVLRLQSTSVDVYSHLVKPFKAKQIVSTGSPVVVAVKQVFWQSPRKRKKKELKFSLVH